MTRSQEVFAEGIVPTFGVTDSKSIPTAVDLELHRLDRNGLDGDEPFRSFVGHLMWIAKQTRPNKNNAVRGVARYCAAPKVLH